MDGLVTKQIFVLPVRWLLHRAQMELPSENSRMIDARTPP